MRKYKLFFWITFFLLLLTNVFWIYNKIDVAVGHSYYKDSCESYEKDLTELKKLLSSKLDKKEMLHYLNENKISYTDFKKGDLYIIQFASFDLIYDNHDDLKAIE